MSELLKNYKYKKQILDTSMKGFLELIFYAVVFGYGLGAILFSNSSLSTSGELETRIEHLKKDIYELNKANATLQKYYFELSSIQGDYDN